jgi:hypothetical protein
MELVFDDEAIADLENIYSWIARIVLRPPRN